MDEIGYLTFILLDLINEVSEPLELFVPHNSKLSLHHDIDSACYNELYAHFRSSNIFHSD